MIVEASLYDQAGDSRVKCNVCSWRCVIPEGKLGFCRTRKNMGGKLYTLIYGSVTSAAADAIEKKPLYHFLPGTLSYSLGSVSCNFRCKNCQNWTISQVGLEESRVMEILPEEAVREAVYQGCRSISWTYNEPAIWHEYTYDTAKLAREEGLKTVYVTNGYITPEALERISPYLDAYRVDIKSMDNSVYREVCGASLEPVLVSARLARKLGMHVEVVNLVIPTVNDTRDDFQRLSVWVKENLGEDTPVHFTRFHPFYKMAGLPSTPVETLELAYNVAREEGIKYPYLGNVPGHRYENTYCPGCGLLLIDRFGFTIRRYQIKGGRCPGCDEKIPVVE